MIHLTRREILKIMAAAGVVGTGFPFPFRHASFAAENNAPILIMVHLRGGCDGLNFISPSNDPDFIAARASDLRVLADGKDVGYGLANGPSHAIDFRLHAAAGGLAELYNHGQIAFIHACGLTDSTRSHFVATDMIENGVGNETDLSRSQSGWLARALESKNTNPNTLKAMAVANTLSSDLQGLDQVLSVPDINNGLPYIGGAPIASALWEMYNNYSGPLAAAGRSALQLPALIDQKVARDEQNHVLPYVPQNGANYDTAGGFANTLKSVARLVKMDIGLEALTIDYGNWDTHEYQAGRFRGLIEPLSNGLAALWNDLSAYHNRVVIVGITEFGRRLRSNKSGGTDHGRAGLMFVLGGQVNGGRFFGKWPGLNSSQLDEGVDLAVTTDYRRVLTETLDHNNGRNNAVIFPNYQYQGPLGLFRKA